MSELDKDLAAFESQKVSLESAHHGKWVVFHDTKLEGVFETFELAAESAVARFGRGPYLIKQVGAPPVTIPASVAYRFANA